ncbi:hypothetical protein M9Y10_006108 [Tritrichomonas musculus]|uniref:Initiator binding domain-containing protein n=1 Tax=Tritrichomonas musculus TaxID=1915356 RepID=A0ABR2JDA7_9EUKA
MGDSVEINDDIFLNYEADNNDSFNDDPSTIFGLCDPGCSNLTSEDYDPVCSDSFFNENTNDESAISQKIEFNIEQSGDDPPAHEANPLYSVNININSLTPRSSNLPSTCNPTLFKCQPNFLQMNYNSSSPVPNNQFYLYHSASNVQFPMNSSCFGLHCSSVRNTYEAYATMQYNYELKKFIGYLNYKISGDRNIRFKKEKLHCLYNIFANHLGLKPLNRDDKRNKNHVFSKLFSHKDKVIECIEKKPEIFLAPALLAE